MPKPRVSPATAPVQLDRGAQVHRAVVQCLQGRPALHTMHRVPWGQRPDRCRACMQVRDDCPPPLSRWYRHISKGAWPFSTRDHGWPIADCSAEGLKVKQLEAACRSGLLAVAVEVGEEFESCRHNIFEFHF